jgi:DNA-binding response OmpR family regulator
VAALAVRLADEGVPLRVIARTLHTPSEEIRLQLRRALDDGTLVDLPKEDWPPGFPRDQRSLQLSRLVTDDKAAVVLAVQRVFGLTSTEVGILMLLMTNIAVPKSRINMVHRTIDVHICRIRHRLSPFGIAIGTLWGYGYQLSTDSRKKLMDLVLGQVEQPA